jgi:hypothetical protein
MWVLLPSAALAIGWLSTAVAQESVDRTVRAKSATDTQVAAFINVSADCTSGPLPTIRLVESPRHGKVVVKNAKASATNYKQCLALQVPAFVAIYRSAVDYAGEDRIVLEVKFANGRTQTQRIKILVAPTGGQKI